MEIRWTEEAQTILNALLIICSNECRIDRRHAGAGPDVAALQRCVCGARRRHFHRTYSPRRAAMAIKNKNKQATTPVTRIFYGQQTTYA
jgi:hypothetical protein